MAFIVALIALVLDVVFWATHALDQTLAILIGLLALGIMLASYDKVSGWLPGRR
jgi:hypothetical protein